MANHKKDYDSILRSKRESKKQRSRKKSNVKITKEYIEKLERLAKIEKENGVDKSIYKTKGNRMFMINKLLYNPYLVPSERLCFIYVFSNTSCEGKLRDGKIINIESNFVKSKNVYTIKINGEIKAKEIGQTNTCEKIKDLIGLPEEWDNEQGSARIFT